MFTRKIFLSVIIVIGLVISSTQVSFGAEQFSRDLSFGFQQDSDVMKLQEFLASEELYSGPITGNFFSLTLKAVKAFQFREGITPMAGYFGPKTRVRANELLGAQVQSSNQQAITETGKNVIQPTTPQTANNPVNNIQLQLEALLKQVALLQQQLKDQTDTNLQAQGQASFANAFAIEKVDVTPDKSSAKIQWQTSKPAESKVFISGGSLSQKMFLSESGLSSNHTVNVISLSPTTNYSYEITAINEFGFVRKSGAFATPDAFAPTFVIDKEEIKNDGIDFATIRIETKLTNGKILSNKALKVTASGVETTIYSDEQGILIYRTRTDNSSSQVFVCGNNPTINISIKYPDSGETFFVKSIKVINIKPPVKW